MDGGARKKCEKGSHRDTRKKYKHVHRCRSDSSPRRKMSKKAKHTFYGSPYKSPEKRKNTHMFFPEGTYVMPLTVGSPKRSPNRLFSPKPKTRALELAVMDSFRNTYRSSGKRPVREVVVVKTPTREIVEVVSPRRSGRATRKRDFLGERVFYGGEDNLGPVDK